MNKQDRAGFDWSQFSGPHKKRQRRAIKHRQAQARNAVSDAQLRDCGHIHGFAVSCHGRVSA